VKVFVVKRNEAVKVALILMLICVSMLYTIGVDSGVLSVFINNDKQLPVYCVETDKKRIAISFDAAWGAQ
jgi:hypothetical protein